MCKSFVHLHNHTEYSLLDGATRIKEMVSRAKEHGMGSLAITDHGVMFGCMEFYFECKKQGVKPILGMEAYVAPKGIENREHRGANKPCHLLLLARNMEGYRNLCKMHTVAALQGFYYNPRIDHDILREHAKGLISSTTCLGSEVNQLLMQGDYEGAKNRAAMYREIFDPGCYFVELQDHGIPEQRECNEMLLKIARELKLPIVATNDAHYLCREDHEPHDVLLCIGTGDRMDDPNRLKFSGNEFYVKTPSEMASLFPQHPEAIENSLMFAEMVEDLDLGNSRAIMPEPTLEEGHTDTTYLRHLAEQGLRARMPNAPDEAWKRLEYELSVIERTGYETYFLLVREFASFTREQGIMFGVRGSAAGSLVSYTVGITDVNPVEYDLTFERFLNPERVSMPDIDMDFEDARRDEVIKWVQQRYGEDRVAQIITFGTLGAKAAIRDSARVMGFLPIEADKVAKTIPNGPGWSIQKAEEEIAEFRQIRDSDPRLQNLIKTAKSIEGISRNAGVHAAGVVIAKDPLSDYVPLYRSNEGLPVTAYEMGILEKIGLLKMDFLGLSNLTVLSRTIQNIRQTLKGVPNDKLLSDHPVLRDGHTGIPLDDAKTYEMLSRGETVGVFQLESGGMRRNIIELKPQNVRELAAMVALYRPGPMEHIPRFVDNKFGRNQAEYLDPKMVPILEETYGIIVYQDQVLKLVQALAGFSLGKADILRRAMGKKDKAIMDSMQAEFVQGATENGVEREVAGKVWELLLPFAGYAFNKAHAVCYAILAYQTAYLKANYPVEYLAALLAVYRGKEDKITTFIEESRRQKIPVLPPNINTSSLDFTIEEHKGKPAIRFGLGAIKGVGEGLVEAIIRERAEGPYENIWNFTERVRPHGLNKGALESLVRAGAFDAIAPNRNTWLRNLEATLVFADNANRLKAAGQESLFGETSEAASLAYPIVDEVTAPDRSEILQMEKETMGIYISDHPLRGYEFILRQQVTHDCVTLLETEEPVKTTVAGVLAQVSKTVSQRTGARVCRITIEDFTGQIGGFLYGDQVTKYDDLLVKDKVVKISGRLKFDDRAGATERRPEIQVFEVKDLPRPVNLDANDATSEGSVWVQIVAATYSQLARFKEVVEKNPGNNEVIIQFEEAGQVAPVVLLNRVSSQEEVIRQLRGSLERCRVSFVPRGELL